MSWLPSDESLGYCRATLRVEMHAIIARRHLGQRADRDGGGLG